MPPPEEVEDTRESILRAAMEAIERDGESAVRVLEVARVAGYSVRMIYYFFGDREGLIEAARARQFIGRGAADVAAISRMIDEAKDAAAFWAGVRRLVAVGREPGRSELRLSRASVIGATWKRPRLAAAIRVEQERVVAALALAVGKAQARGFFDPALSPAAIAMFIQSYSFGRVMADICGPGALDEDAWEAVLNRALGALSPPSQR